MAWVVGLSGKEQQNHGFRHHFGWSLGGSRRPDHAGHLSALTDHRASGRRTETHIHALRAPVGKYLHQEVHLAWRTPLLLRWTPALSAFR